jgi:hypothetical protein
VQDARLGPRCSGHLPGHPWPQAERMGPPADQLALLSVHACWCRAVSGGGGGAQRRLAGWVTHSSQARLRYRDGVRSLTVRRFREFYRWQGLATLCITRASETIIGETFVVCNLTCRDICQTLWETDLAFGFQRGRKTAHCTLAGDKTILQASGRSLAGNSC